MVITVANYRPPTLNVFYTGVKHWIRISHKVDVRWLVREALEDGLPEPFEGRVDISVTVYFDKRPYDSDNIPAKLFIDALCECDVLVDDTPKYVRKVTTESRVDRERPRVVIEIERVEE